MQGKKDYQEKLFIRFQLSDYVPTDNFYRRLKSILDLTFLYDTTAKYYGSEGQKSIDPVVFFKLMLVGYLENLNSDRRIISTSRMRMDILYFIGYDLDEELPWHSTLSRTRQLYGEEEFTAIFKAVLKQCIDNGLVAGRRQAVDSVLVKANAALSSVVERQVLDDVADYGKELDANTERPVADNVIKLKDNIKEPPKPINQTMVSPSDPDARISFKPGKVVALNYLGQVAVDTSDHIITHIQAFHADKGDGQCFTEVLKHTVSNLGDNDLKVEEVIADAGYSSEPALLALMKYQVEGFIPNKKGFIDDRAGFTYDAENDRYKCTEGKYLTFRHFRVRGDSTHKLYKTNIKDCKDCPFKQTCTNPSIGIKVIRDSSVKQLYAQMAHRIQSTKGRKMSKIRAGTVESVIGTLVNFTGMKKVNTKGIALANKCMIMAAVAYNLKKLLKAKLASGKNSPNDKLTAILGALDRLMAFLLAQLSHSTMTLFIAYRKGKQPIGHLPFI